MRMIPRCFIPLALLGLLACSALAQWYDGAVWSARSERGFFGIRSGFAHVYHEGGGVFRGQFVSDNYPFDYISVWPENGGVTRFEWWNFWFGRYGHGWGEVQIQMAQDGRMLWTLSVRSDRYPYMDMVYADLTPR